MAKNERLAEIVLGSLFDFVKGIDPLMMDETKEEWSQFVQREGEIQTDLDSKFRIKVAQFLAHGYDFNRTFDGRPTRKMYEILLRNIKRISGSHEFGKYISSDIVDGRYGWCITEV